MGKYDNYIYTVEEFKVEPLRWEEVKTAITSNLETAGGLDVWRKKELAWISDEAITWITAWLSMIERTHTWPESLTKTRSAFL